MGVPAPLPNGGRGSVKTGSTDVLCLSIVQRPWDCQWTGHLFVVGPHDTVSAGLWLGLKGNRTISDITSKHARQALLGNPKCFPYALYSG